MTRHPPITMTERDALFAALEHETIAQVAQRFARHPRTVGQLRTLRVRQGLPVAQTVGRQEAYLRAAVKRAQVQAVEIKA